MCCSRSTKFIHAKPSLYLGNCELITANEHLFQDLLSDLLSPSMVESLLYLVTLI